MFKKKTSRVKIYSYVTYGEQVDAPWKGIVEVALVMGAASGLDVDLNGDGYGHDETADKVIEDKDLWEEDI